jgi:hypothetical protein
MNWIFLLVAGVATDFLRFSNVDIIDLSKDFVNDSDEASLCWELPKITFQSFDREFLGSRDCEVGREHRVQS